MKSIENFYHGIGISSILMIFVVLCLTTFSILSYVTVKADYALTQKNSKSVKEYYQADSDADRVLQTVDNELSEAAECAEYLGNHKELSEMPSLSSYNTLEDFNSIEELAGSNYSAEEKSAISYLYFAKVLLSDIDNLTVDEISDVSDVSVLQVTITIPMNTMQELQLILKVNSLNNEKRYTVVSHKEITTDEWEQQQEQSLNVWQGE